MPVNCRHAIRALAVLTLASPGLSPAQQPPAKSASDDSVRDDIIVRGLRDRLKLPTKVAPPAGVSGVQSRVRYELSERIAACAARARVAPVAYLRAVVDGEFGSARHAAAQDRLRRAYITCGEGGNVLSMTKPDPSASAMSTAGSSVMRDFTGAPVDSDPAPFGHSIYDRGAFTIAAMRRFAPDLRLTRAETDDPAVQARFNLREVPRNRYRLRADMRYFEVAVCIVRLQPALSVQLALGSGGARQSNLQAELINRARDCVGGAKTVTVDATQFRIYIADAVYRWTVAARGVTTLLPDADVGEAGR